MDNIIYGVDFKAKTRQHIEQQSLEQQAINTDYSILSWIKGGVPDPGMVGMEFGLDTVIYESSLGFVAPEKDPA